MPKFRYIYTADSHVPLRMLDIVRDGGDGDDDREIEPLPPDPADEKYIEELEDMVLRLRDKVDRKNERIVALTAQLIQYKLAEREVVL